MALSTNHLKQARYCFLTLSVIILINVTPINAQEVSPSPDISPTPTTEPSPSPDISPTPTPTPETSQFYDTPTNIEAAVIIMQASKRWGVIIYPAIYAVQIIGIILRYV